MVDLDQAKANLAAAHARVAQQHAALRHATFTLDRMKALIKDQFVSQQDLDNAQVTFDGAVAVLESLQAQVTQMEVALAQAETNLAYSYIRAPFAGYVAERNLDTGAYVTGTAASTSTMSRGMMSLHDLDTVRVLIEVVEKDIPLITIGQKAELRAEAYPDQVFEGTVTRVEVLVGTHPDAVQIPIDAVSRLEEAQYVFVVRDGKAQRVNVEIGARKENRVEIVTGLFGDEAVIVSGKDLVHDGTPVQAQPLPKS
jgi:multidrug resistance efflux pump